MLAWKLMKASRRRTEKSGCFCFWLCPEFLKLWANHLISLFVSSFKKEIMLAPTLLFFFAFFLRLYPRYVEVPRLGVESELQLPCWPTPQPQQCWIWAASVTHTTAHGNSGSLTHWARSGVEPASSWILVGFISSAPQELPAPTLIRHYELEYSPVII